MDIAVFAHILIYLYTYRLIDLYTYLEIKDADS